jgi:opacity protein-like surface antigen
MKVRLVLSAALLAAVVPVAAQAQFATPFSIEGRAGAVVPIGDFGDTEVMGAKTGFGFGVNGAYRVIPMLDLYAGFSWHRFGVEDDPEFGDVNFDLDDSGFEVGARLFVPGMTGISPWVQGGLILQQLKMGGSEGGISASLTSDRAAGFEVGAGAAFPLTPNLSLTPGVRYRQFKAKFDLPFIGSESLDVQYLAADLGVQFRF